MNRRFPIAPVGGPRDIFDKVGQMLAVAEGIVDGVKVIHEAVSPLFERQRRR